MTLAENIAFQRARIKGWGLVEEGWRVLRDCYAPDSCDYKNYDKEIRHPQVCRTIAERELVRLLERQVGSKEELARYDPCQVCNPFGVDECVGHLATQEKAQCDTDQE